MAIPELITIGEKEKWMVKTESLDILQTKSMV